MSSQLLDEAEAMLATLNVRSSKVANKSTVDNSVANTASNVPPTTTPSATGTPTKSKFFKQTHDADLLLADADALLASLGARHATVTTTTSTPSTSTTSTTSTTSIPTSSAAAAEAVRREADLAAARHEENQRQERERLALERKKDDDARTAKAAAELRARSDKVSAEQRVAKRQLEKEERSVAHANHQLPPANNKLATAAASADVSQVDSLDDLMAELVSSKSHSSVAASSSASSSSAVPKTTSAATASASPATVSTTLSKSSSSSSKAAVADIIRADSLLDDELDKAAASRPVALLPVTPRSAAAADPALAAELERDRQKAAEIEREIEALKRRIADKEAREAREVVKSEPLQKKPSSRSAELLATLDAVASIANEPSEQLMWQGDSSDEETPRSAKRNGRKPSTPQLPKSAPPPLISKGDDDDDDAEPPPPPSKPAPAVPLSAPPPKKKKKSSSSSSSSKKKTPRSSGNEDASQDAPLPTLPTAPTAADAEIASSSSALPPLPTPAATTSEKPARPGDVVQWRPADKRGHRSSTMRPTSNSRQSYHPATERERERSHKHSSMRRQAADNAAPPPPPEEEYVWESAAALANVSALAVAPSPRAASSTSPRASVDAAAQAAESRRSYARRHTTRDLPANGGASEPADASLSPRGKQCVRCGHSARIMLRVGTATEPSPLCRSCAEVAQSATATSPSSSSKARPGAAPAGTPIILDVRIPHIDVAKKMKFTTDTPVSVVVKEVLAMLHKSTLIPEHDVTRPYVLLRRETDPLSDALSTRRTVGELGLSIKTPVFLVRKPVQGDIYLDV